MRTSELFPEQIRLLYSHQLAVFLAHIAGLIVTTTLFRNSADTATLIVWSISICVVATYRIVIWQLHRIYQQRYSATTWAWLAVAGAITGGMAWGVGSILLFVPDSLLYQMMMLFILGAFANGSLVISAVYLPSHHGFLFPLLLPITIYHLFQPSIDSKILAMLPFIILVVHLLISHSINRSIIDSLKLRFENVELVEKLRQQKQEAEEANAAKSRFLAAASHDLRQPLHAMAMFTGILDERISDQENSTIIGKLKSSVVSLEKLFNSLLDISRLDAGIIVPRSVTFDLMELLDQLKDEYLTHTKEKGLDLILPDKSTVIKSDPVLLGTVLRNVLSNAIRYTEKGEIRITIEQFSVSDVMLQISDTGVGIHYDQLNRVFEEYYQINNPERDREKGLGLGLAIVKRILSILDITYRLQSVPGKGTCFYLRLPKGEPAEAMLLTESADRNVVGKLRRKILVIDDEQLICEGIATLLRDWGCEVEACQTEDEALSLVSEAAYRPDIIIADYRLRHNTNGVDVIKRLRWKLDEDIPAAIITGDMAPSVLRHVQNNGLIYLSKPVKPVRLKTLLFRLAQKNPAEYAG